jgi:hypothetical protein
VGVSVERDAAAATFVFDLTTPGLIITTTEITRGTCTVSIFFAHHMPIGVDDIIARNCDCLRSRTSQTAALRPTTRADVTRHAGLTSTESVVRAVKIRAIALHRGTLFSATI